MLTFVLKNTRRTSVETATRVAERLGLSESESTYLRLLAEREIAKKSDQVRSIDRKLAKFRLRGNPSAVPLERFEEPLRFAAMEILEIAAVLPIGPRTRARILKTLGIDRPGLERILDVFTESGALTRNSKGEYVRVPGEVAFTVSGDKTIADSIHSRFLDSAGRTLTKLPPEKRVYASGVFSIRKERLESFRKKAYALFDDFHDESLAEESPDAVYGLSIAAFSLFERSHDA